MLLHGFKLLFMVREHDWFFFVIFHLIASIVGVVGWPDRDRLEYNFRWRSRIMLRQGGGHDGFTGSVEDESDEDKKKEAPPPRGSGAVFNRSAWAHESLKPICRRINAMGGNDSGWREGRFRWDFF